MQSSPAQLAAKASQLQAHLKTLGRILVAYSGGIDSAYLAWAAHNELQGNMLAVTADSPSLARTQLADALQFAQEQGIPVEVVSTFELERAEYARNDGQRCFQCKDELFTVMENLRGARGFDTIAYGVNLDDQGDFRPGQAAAKLHHVAAPLLDAQLTKQDIRELAIRALGFRQFRVRHHGDIVRIEIDRDELSRALDPSVAAQFTAIFKQLGFKFVTLDLEGFRSGSMNTLLPVDQLHRGR
jgi:pyridinium-3,5-biscarboxylic acid mononucleotide sulfurtransferase